MGLNIGTRDWGGADATYAWVLHVSGATAPASGGTPLTVSLGSGADSALLLWSDAIGIGTASNHAKLVPGGTVTREYLLPDHAGTLEVFTLKTASYVLNSTTSYVAVPGLQATLADGLYEIDGIINCATVTDTDPLRFKLEGDAGVTGNVFIMGHNGATRSGVSTDFRADGDAALPAIFEQAVTPDTGLQILMIRGVVRFASSSTGLTAYCAVSVGSGGVTVFGDSYLRFRRIKA